MCDANITTKTTGYNNITAIITRSPQQSNTSHAKLKVKLGDIKVLILTSDSAPILRTTFGTKTSPSAVRKTAQTSRESGERG